MDGKGIAGMKRVVDSSYHLVLDGSAYFMGTNRL